MILPQRKRGPRSTRGWEKAQWESDASSRLLYAHAGVSWTNAVCARAWNCVRHFGPNWKLSTRPNSGSFPVSPHHFSLKYIQYSCEKMVCATRKSLAVGHISRFQIDPFQKKRMCLLMQLLLNIFRAQMYDQYICALFIFFKNGFVQSVFHTKTFRTAWIKVRCKNALP